MDHIQAVARDGGVVLRLLQLGGGGDAVAGQVALANDLLVQVVHLGLRLGQFAAGFLPGGAGGFDHGSRGVQLGIGLGQRDAERLRIQLDQHVAGMDGGMVADQHGHHLAGHFRGNLGDVGLHIGIFRADGAPALQPHRDARDDHQRRHADQQSGPDQKTPTRHHGASCSAAA